MAKTHRNTSDGSLYDTAVDTFISEGGFVSAAHPEREREREMIEFSVSYDGLRYRYNGYRYDQFVDDAVSYAKLVAQRPRTGGPL
jgi:hypothetical protein